MAPRWFYSLDGRTKVGPIPLEDLRQLAGAGQLKPTHMILPENTGKWQPASAMPELFVPAPAPKKQAPPPAPAQRPEPPRAPRTPAMDEATESSRPSAVNVCLTAPLVACKEIGRRVSLARLRRRQRKLKQAEQQLLGRLGSGLLGAGSAIPGGEPFVAEFRKLQEQRLTAEQSAQKAETARLTQKSEAMSVRFGQLAINSKAAFTGRAEAQPRWERLRQDQAKTEAAIGQREKAWAAAPRRVKGQVLAGLALFVAVLVLVPWLVWSLKPATPDPVVRTEPPPVEKDPPLVKQPLNTLFTKLSPSVPVVRAIDAGSGSGFLVKHKDRHLVITNRHVVENSRKGIAVEFLGKDGEVLCTIPAGDTAVIAIHRAADLAIVDVSKGSANLAKHKLEPVRLAPRDHKPEAGEEVFAIGHPGAGEGVLAHTLTKGIVSGIGRSHPDKTRKEEARYLQTTAPINPGNSGGPLFDYFGQVVGVNTFIIRADPNKGIMLEGLGFSLESRFIHDLLTDPATTLDKQAIAGILAPAAPAGSKEWVRERFTQLRNEGFRFFGLGPEDSTRTMRVPPEGQGQVVIHCTPGETYAVVGLTNPPGDAFLAAHDGREVIARSKTASASPDLVFSSPRGGPHVIIAVNKASRDAEIFLVLFRK